MHCALAGPAAGPAGEDGIDLLPILSGKEPERERTLFWRRKKGVIRKSVEEGRAVRHGPWKLVEQATGERFLFHLTEDIGETRNLLDEKPDLAAKLSAELDAWERSVDSQSP